MSTKKPQPKFGVGSDSGSSDLAMCNIALERELKARDVEIAGLNAVIDELALELGIRHGDPLQIIKWGYTEIGWENRNATKADPSSFASNGLTDDLRLKLVVADVVRTPVPRDEPYVHQRMVVHTARPERVLSQHFMFADLPVSE